MSFHIQFHLTAINPISSNAGINMEMLLGGVALSFKMAHYSKNYKETSIFSLMKGIGKKGQLSIFIIIGIVIVAAVVLLLLYSQGTIKFNSASAFSPETYLR